MSTIHPIGGRLLSDSEREAFAQLGLSPGNWAALVAAPFFHRSGLRPPNLQKRGDWLHLETLRRELRTVSGLSEQTGQFWTLLGSGGPAEVAELGTRLLAWYLATDLSFAKREQILRRVGTIAGEFMTGSRLDADQALVEDLRLLIDYYLPCNSFPTDSTPRWVHVPLPSLDVVDILTQTISSDAGSWPQILPTHVTSELPTLIVLLGEPVTDWWGKPQIGKRAVERGLASISFSERERLYAELVKEWPRAYRAVPQEGVTADPLIHGIREWVDAVRKSVRQSTGTHDPRRTPPVLKPPTPVAPVVVVTPWRCPRCEEENPASARECKGCRLLQLSATMELRAATTGKALRLEDGMRVGRSEYRDIFGLPEAGIAAADQFEVLRDATRGVWLIKPLEGVRQPTCYQGEEIETEGCEVASEGVISVGDRLKLVVRFV